MINVLTYSKPHRKTQDLLLLLKAKGYGNITVLAYPWQNRPNHEPLIPHRAFEPIDIELIDLCINLSYEYREIHQYQPKSGIYLIGGAGILPRDFVRSGFVINSHPGYLPYVRGLDALKWAIIEGLPIGVTTHKVDEIPDAGWLIDQEIMNPYDWETFHGFAYRIYEREIQMLVEAIERIETSDLKPINVQNYWAHKRMPARTEMNLLKKFEDIKKGYK